MDLKGWLQSLGLQQYEAVLRKNEIDEGVLPDLTEDHLRELGFPTLVLVYKIIEGHRHAVR
jgi:SAM domain (Sterile alpha motif).